MRPSTLACLGALAGAAALALPARGDPPPPAAKYLVEKPPGRHALVIGNSNYEKLVAIPSAEQDAVAVTDRLGSLGFSVTGVTGGVASYSDFEDRVLPDFRTKLSEGDLVVLYYSGHGFAYGAESYLAPTSLQLQVPASDLNTAAIPVSALEEYVSRKKPGYLLIVLDSCRTIGGFVVEDQATTRGVAKGYRAPSSRPHLLNTVVAYATWAGEEAQGGAEPDQPSAFTGALANHLADEGLTFGSMFRVVSDEVVQATHQQQQPGLADWALSELYLKPSAADLARQREAWMAALTSSNPQDAVERYLRMFAVSPHAAAARAWLADHAQLASSGYSLVSPAAVEQAWEESARSEQPIMLQRAATALGFRRTMSSGTALAAAVLPGTALGVVKAGTPPAGARFPLAASSPEVLAALGELVTVKDLVARRGPSASAPEAKQLRPGTLLRIASVKVVGGEGTWAAATVQGSDELVFLPVPLPAEPLAPVVLGHPLREVTVPRLAGASGFAVDTAALERLLASLRDVISAMTWVSLAAAPEADPREADRRAAALTHLEYLLRRHGIDGTRITSVQGATDVPPGELRMRFFGF